MKNANLINGTALVIAIPCHAGWMEERPVKFPLPFCETGGSYVWAKGEDVRKKGGAEMEEEIVELNGSGVL